MKGTTHILGGISSGLFVLSATPEFNFETGAIAMCISIAGSVLPDIDTDVSFISNFLKPLRWIMRLVLKPFKCGVHRGITHSLVFALMLSSPLWFVNKTYAIALFLGLVSHMILDLLSNGIYLFAPFYNKRITIAKIKTGTEDNTSFGEKLVTFVLCVLIFCQTFALARNGIYRLINPEEAIENTVE